MHSPSESSGLSRRSIVGAAAWSAPAIVLSAASPATATSLGILSVRPESPTVQAGTPTSIQIGLAPAGSLVPITIDFDPAGAITTSPTDIISLGDIGQAVVSLSTILTEPQIVTAVATAPGYAPVTFTINIEAPTVVEPEPDAPKISLVRGPSSVAADTSPSLPFTVALTPSVQNAPVTLRSVPAGLLTFSPGNIKSDGAGQAHFTVSTTVEENTPASIVASSTGYPDLTIPISIVAPEVPLNQQVRIQQYTVIDGLNGTGTPPYPVGGQTGNSTIGIKLIDPDWGKAYQYAQYFDVEATMTDLDGNPSDAFAVTPSRASIIADNFTVSRKFVVSLKRWTSQQELGVLTLRVVGSHDTKSLLFRGGN